jgi:hypothetical protein
MRNRASRVDVNLQQVRPRILCFDNSPCARRVQVSGGKLHAPALGIVHRLQMSVTGFAQREESIMSNEKPVPLKAVAVAALIAVVALVVVSLEAPRVITAPDAPLANVASAFLTADGPPPEASSDVVGSTVATQPSDLHASSTATEYFPSRFGAPQSAPEAPAPTF